MNTKSIVQTQRDEESGLSKTCGVGDRDNQTGPHIIRKYLVDKISRKDDESVYQPKIHKDRIRQLYILKETTGVPMTDLLDEAISYYLPDYRNIKKNEYR